MARDSQVTALGMFSEELRHAPLVFTSDEWKAFTAGVNNGEFGL